MTAGSTGMSVLLLQHPTEKSRGFSGPLQPKNGWHKCKAQGLWQWSALNGLSPYQSCPGPAKAIPLHGPLSFILSLLPHCPTLVRITCTHCKTDLSPLCLPLPLCSTQEHQDMSLSWFSLHPARWMFSISLEASRSLVPSLGKTVPSWDSFLFNLSPEPWTLYPLPARCLLKVGSPTPQP